jgi:hypothetical protein|uniref:hypothetical protein n=1 Tax=Cephaloticoccus sp. TaxID=1985742 RepID=UPI004049807D
MSAAPASIIQWLTRYTGFPARRLDTKAELMVLFASAAENEEPKPAVNGGPIIRKDTAQQASQRAIAMNRSLAHFKSDNRTAV